MKTTDRTTLCAMCAEVSGDCGKCKLCNEVLEQRMKKNHPKAIKISSVKALISKSYTMGCHLTFRKDSLKCRSCDLKSLCKKGSSERKYIKRIWRTKKDVRRRSTDTIKGASDFSDLICTECHLTDDCDGTFCKLVSEIDLSEFDLD